MLMRIPRFSWFAGTRARVGRFPRLGAAMGLVCGVSSLLSNRIKGRGLELGEGRMRRRRRGRTIVASTWYVACADGQCQIFHTRDLPWDGMLCIPWHLIYVSSYISEMDAK